MFIALALPSLARPFAMALLDQNTSYGFQTMTQQRQTPALHESCAHALRMA